MLLFGHIGLTLATGLMANRILVRDILNQPVKQAIKTAPVVNIEAKQIVYPTTRKLFLIGFLILGSMLPDIIDKLVGMYFFRQTFGNNGRIFSHTLAFLLLFLITGFGLYLTKKTTVLLFTSLGIFMHLVLDSMWLTPQTLVWPLLGWHFPEEIISDWFGTLFQELLHDPSVYIPELVGIIIVAWFIWILWKKKLASIFP